MAFSLFQKKMVIFDKMLRIYSPGNSQKSGFNIPLESAIDKLQIEPNSRDHWKNVITGTLPNYLTVVIIIIGRFYRSSMK